MEGVRRDLLLSLFLWGFLSTSFSCEHPSSNPSSPRRQQFLNSTWIWLAFSSTCRIRIISPSQKQQNQPHHCPSYRDTYPSSPILWGLSFSPRAPLLSFQFYPFAPSTFGVISAACNNYLGDTLELYFSLFHFLAIVNSPVFISFYGGQGLDLQLSICKGRCWAEIGKWKHQRE